jgi:hypothetical protein
VTLPSINLTTVPDVSQMSRMFQSHALILVRCREYSHSMPFYGCDVENIPMACPSIGQMSRISLGMPFHWSDVNNIPTACVSPLHFPVEVVLHGLRVCLTILIMAVASLTKSSLPYLTNRRACNGNILDTTDQATRLFLKQEYRMMSVVSV